MSPDQAFKHQRLDPELSDFRLVRILPQSHDGSCGPISRVSCSCFHSRLHQCEKYVALSYTWGDARNAADIMINGKVHSVTTNLEQVLQYLQSKMAPVNVWIDALCINQHDPLEKSAQVARMREIYRHADRVVAWLGVSTRSHLAAQWLHDFGQRAAAFSPASLSDSQASQIACTTQMTTEDPQQSLIHDLIQDVTKSFLSNDDHARNTPAAILELVSQPYWSRVWVVQEVDSAKRIDFLYGGDTISEDALFSALRLLRSFALSDLPQPGDMIHGLNAINMLKIRRAPTKPELIYLIRMTAAFEATLDSDRIFALLGCAADAHMLGLRPDYSLNRFQVFVQTTFALLKHGYFDIWSFCRLTDKHTCLPSWTPDYRCLYSGRWPLQERALNRANKAGLSMLQPGYNASGSRRDELALVHFPKSNLLCLRAMPLGSIEALGLEADWKGPGCWIQQLHQLFKETKEYKDNELLEAICYTSVADQEPRNGGGKPRLSAAIVQQVVSLLESTEQWHTLTQEAFDSAGLEMFADQVKLTSSTRRPFRLASSVGIGPTELQKGDELYLVPGAQVPFAFRAVSSQPHKSVLIGEVYLHGAMDGELSAASACVPLTVC